MGQQQSMEPARPRQRPRQRQQQQSSSSSSQNQQQQQQNRSSSSSQNELQQQGADDDEIKEEDEPVWHPEGPPEVRKGRQKIKVDKIISKHWPKLKKLDCPRMLCLF